MRNKQKKQSDDEVNDIIFSIEEISKYHFDRVVKKGELKWLLVDPEKFNDYAAPRCIVALEGMLDQWLEALETTTEQESKSALEREWCLKAAEYSIARIDLIERRLENPNEMVLDDTLALKQKFLSANAKLTKQSNPEDKDGKKYSDIKTKSAIESFKGFSINTKDISVAEWIVYLNEFNAYLQAKKEEKAKEKFKK